MTAKATPATLTPNLEIEVAKIAGLENVRFRDRPTAYLCQAELLGGAKPKFTLGASGHSSIAFTMDFCSPIIEGVRQDAMMLLDGVLPKTEDGLFAESKARLTPPLDVRLSGARNSTYAPIAQRTRAPVFGTGGRGFESL
jgi:hypothetical protein